MTSTPSGSPPPDASALPFAELLAELRRRGFGIGLHDYKDVARLAARWQGVDRATFRDALAALLARNAEEVQGIRAAFDEWMDVPPPSPPPAPPPQPRARTWHVVALALLLVAGGAGGAWWLLARYYEMQRKVVVEPGRQPPVPVTERPTTPPPVLPVPPRKPASELPWLAAAAAAAVTLVALGIWETRSRQKRWAGKYWRYVLSQEPGPHHYELRLGRPAPALPRDVVEEAATILGRARETDPADGDVLDVDGSLHRTLGAGMAPHLVFAPPPRAAPVLVLQDVSWQMRPWAAKVDAFAAALRRRGVLIERWYFDGDPLQVSRAPHGRTIALESLSLSRAEASLMVLSSGQGIGAARLRVLARLLGRWRFRTWLHPVGNPAYWRPEIASLPLRTWPMTPAGVRAAAVELSRRGDLGVPPKLARPRDVTSGDVERMRQLLAMSPGPTLELAGELRRRFAPEVPEEVVLFLGAEGVFYGETIPVPPGQLPRLLAAAALEPVRERNVRRYLLDVLRDSRPPEQSGAYLRWQLDEAVQRLRLDPADAEARDLVQSLANGPLRDEVHAAVSAQGLGVEVKDRPVRELSQAPPRSLGKRPPLWAWPRAATAVAALLVVLPPTLVLTRRVAAERGDPIPHRQVLSLTRDAEYNLVIGASPLTKVAVLYRGDEGFSQVDLPSKFVVEDQFRGAWFRLREPLSAGNLLTSGPVWVPAARKRPAAPMAPEASAAANSPAAPDRRAAPVYLQIADERQRPAARGVQAFLRSQGYNAPGIERVGQKAPKDVTQVRYFDPADVMAAEGVAALLQSRYGIAATPAHISIDQALPGQLEVWFTPGAFNGTRP